MAASNQEGRNFCACNVGCRLMSRPWVACVLAVLELVLGFILLSFPLMLGLSAVWVSGFVLGVAGLVILLCYMCSKAGILRYTRLCAGCLGLLGLVFTINPPASLAGDLNLRYAASNPQWAFSTSDFKSGCFNVYDNLAFATYVYELEKQKCGDLNDEALDTTYRRARVSFESRMKHAASMVEDRNRSWTLFTLRSCWDRPAAEYVLGRPIGEKKVEETH